MSSVRLGVFVQTLAILLALAAIQPATAQDGGLPVEVQIDMAVTALERAMVADDHAEVLVRIEQLHGFDPALAGGEMLYFEAQAAVGTGDIDRAERALDRFLAEVGRQSASYADALVLKLDMPALREAKAEVDRVAEIERRAEEERQREAAAQAEEERLRAGEAALNLSTAALRHIRWILHQENGQTFVPPADADALSDTEREWLAAYLRRVGIPFSGYLNATIAAHFRSTLFQPHSLLDDHPRPQQREGIGDWVLLVEAIARECEIRTPATHATPNSIFAIPNMRIGIDRGQSDASVGILALSPYLFATDRPITAVAAGQRIPLIIRSGVLIPQHGPGPFLSALRAADRMEITGFNLFTGKNETATFSAMGFTRAYTRMAELCNAPRILSWIQ